MKPVLLDQSACAKPEHLPLVDAAFERPGGDAGDLMRETLCKRCPAGHQCLAWAMGNREFGVWGGTSPNARTRHGGPGRDTAQTSAAPRRASSYRYHAIAAADVPTATIRAWALAHGLPVHPTRGRIGEAIREQYVAAHESLAS